MATITGTVNEYDWFTGRTELLSPSVTRQELTVSGGNTSERNGTVQVSSVVSSMFYPIGPGVYKRTQGQSGYAGQPFAGAVISSGIIQNIELGLDEMGYSLGDKVYAGFSTQRLDTGIATNADSGTIVMRLYHNTTLVGSVTFTVVNVLTGVYLTHVTIPSLTLVPGEINVVHIVAEAQVNAITGRRVIATYVLGATGGGGATDWSAAERAQIRDALGITGSTTASTGGVLQGVKTKTDQLTFIGSDVVATLNGEKVDLDYADVVDFPGSTDKTLLDIVRAAWAQGAGKWNIDTGVSPPLLKLYAPDNTTVMFTFELTPSGTPFLTRTPV